MIALDERTMRANRVLKAMQHEYRRAILASLDDRGEPKSPGELAAELEIPVPHAAYHFRVLAGVDLIRPVRIAPAQGCGAVVHYFQITDAGRRAREVVAAMGPLL